MAEVVSGFAAADGALFVMDASGGVEAGLETRRRARPVDRPGGLLLHQQVRPENAEPDRRARRAAGDVRQQDRAAPPGDRRRRGVQRLRRPRPSQGLAVRRQDRGRDPDPGRARRRGRPPPRPAARGRGRGRRRRPDQVPRGRGDQRRGARRLPPPRRPRLDPRAGPRRQRREGHRHDGAARRVHPLHADRRRGAGRSRRRTRRPAPTVDDQPGPGRPARRPRRSRPRPTRSSAG